MGAPTIIISSAGRAPIRRGSRWVPPAPGTMPRVISGMPIRASFTAAR
jgi:hypothetical protein